MLTDGYPSNNDNTFVDYGFDNCPGREPSRIRRPARIPTALSPRMRRSWRCTSPRGQPGHLEKLRQHFDIYGRWGFWDSVNVSTGEVAHTVLALDQGMIMAALGNALRN